MLVDTSRFPGDSERLPADATSRSARGVYGISVASELSGIGPQTLRLYERWGLLKPSRTPGDDDLERLKQITDLVQQGVNLAGIARILDLESKNSQLASHNTRLQLDNAKLKAGRPAAAGTVGSKRGRRGSDDGRRGNRGRRRNA
jgi:MerR family transcriptional regulator/heat shock protein HspR